MLRWELQKPLPSDFETICEICEPVSVHWCCLILGLNCAEIGSGRKHDRFPDQTYFRRALWKKSGQHCRKI